MDFSGASTENAYPVDDEADPAKPRPLRPATQQRSNAYGAKYVAIDEYTSEKRE
jgi:hypothetical protein